MEKQLKIISNFSINPKEWEGLRKLAKENGINTFAELEMYCRVWGIESFIDLNMQLLNDHIETIYQNYKKGVAKSGNN